MVITGSLGERLGGHKLSRGFESRPLRQFLNGFLGRYFKIKIGDRARRGGSGAL